MKYIVAIGAYNAEKLIGACIASVRRQTSPDWICVVIDDCSTDQTLAAAREAAGQDPRIIIQRNEMRKYLLANTAAAIALARPDPEDVVVWLDGDDALSGADVFDRLKQAYEQGAWLTYGSYAGSDGARGVECRAYPGWVARANAYRWTDWRASHLKTFKVWLWRKIQPADLTITQEQYREFLRYLLLSFHWLNFFKLRKVPHAELVDPAGDFFRRCTDKAVMLPMLEMAGERARFIPEVLYAYNNLPSAGPKKEKKLINRFVRYYLRTRRRYRRV